MLPKGYILPNVPRNWRVPVFDATSIERPYEDTQLVKIWRLALVIFPLKFLSVWGAARHPSVIPPNVSREWRALVSDFTPIKKILDDA